MTMTDMSKEYAVALFMLAREEDCSSLVSESLAFVRNTIEAHEGYLDLLASPAIPINERLGLIDEAFGELHPYAISFLKLLCERSYIRFLYDAIDEFEHLLAEASQVLTANVTCAVTLDDNQKAELKKKLEAKFGHPVEICTSVDATVLGGMIIEIDGKRIDASLRRRLSDIKDVISR